MWPFGKKKAKAIEVDNETVHEVSAWPHHPKNKNQTIFAGDIGRHGLSEWWATFSKEDRKYIETKVSWLVRDEPGPLHASACLAFGVAIGYFSKNETQEKRIAYAIADEYQRQAKASSDILDLHFCFSLLIKLYYRDRDISSDAFDRAVAICESQIAISGLAADALRKEYPEGLPGHNGYEQLRVIRDKAGDYNGAIALCRQAMEQGWGGTWEDDIALELKRSKAKTR